MKSIGTHYFFTGLLCSLLFSPQIARSAEKSCVQKKTEIISKTVAGVGTCSEPSIEVAFENNLYLGVSTLAVRYKVQSLVVIEDTCSRRVLLSQTYDETIVETMKFTSSDTIGATKYYLANKEAALAKCEAYRSSF